MLHGISGARQLSGFRLILLTSSAGPNKIFPFVSIPEGERRMGTKIKNLKRTRNDSKMWAAVQAEILHCILIASKVSELHVSYKKVLRKMLERNEVKWAVRTLRNSIIYRSPVYCTSSEFSRLLWAVLSLSLRRDTEFVRKFGGDTCWNTRLKCEDEKWF